MHEQHMAARRRKTIEGAGDRATTEIAVGLGVSEKKAREATLDTPDTVPRKHLENALSAANLAWTGRGKSEAKAARLREALQHIDHVDTGHHAATARATLDAEAGDRPAAHTPSADTAAAARFSKTTNAEEGNR